MFFFKKKKKKSTLNGKIKFPSPTALVSQVEKRNPLMGTEAVDAGGLDRALNRGRHSVFDRRAKIQVFYGA